MRPPRFTLAAAIVLIGVLIARESNAQECAHGRVATDLTLYHCCWPGQVWSDGRAQCEGPPICPPGTTRFGSDCDAMLWLTPMHVSATGAAVRIASPGARVFVTIANDPMTGDGAYYVCQTPCTRQLEGGSYRVESWLPGTPRISHERVDITRATDALTLRVPQPALRTMRGGIIALGALSIFTGIVLIEASIYVQSYSYCASACSYSDATRLNVVGVTVIVSGVVTMLVGIALARVWRFRAVPHERHNALGGALAAGAARF